MTKIFTKYEGSKKLIDIYWWSSHLYFFYSAIYDTILELLTFYRYINYFLVSAIHRQKIWSYRFFTRGLLTPPTKKKEFPPSKKVSASSFQPKKICLHSFPPPPIKKFYIQQKIAPAVLRLTHTLNPPIQTPPLTQHFKTLNPHCWSFRITRNAGGGHIVPTTLQTKKIEGLRRIFKSENCLWAVWDVLGVEL